MNHNLFAVRRWIARFASLAVVAVAFSGLVGRASAQDIVRVEEDWELVLGQPDQNVCGPQVCTTMSPFNNIRDTYFTLEVNHRSAPYWTPGGLTIHQWTGEWRTQSYDRADRTVMNTNNETVTWTQAMYVNSGQLTFQILDGTSATWGLFGYSGMFKVHTNWGVGNLNSYTPAVSVAESYVSYAGNRVQSLKLKEVRLTLSDGEVLTDDTVRVAHQLVE